MKFMCNQQGYVLLTVLLTTVLTSMFALMLIPKAMNTSLQANRSEAAVQVKELAEMGINFSIPYLQTVVQKAIEDAKKDPNLNNKRQNVLFCEKLRLQLNPNPGIIPTVKINQIHSFQLSYHVTYFKKNPDDSTQLLQNGGCEDFDFAEVEIISVGKVNKDQLTERSIKVRFSIKNRSTHTECPVADPSCQEQSGNYDGTRPADPNNLDLVVLNHTDSNNNKYYDIRGSTSQTLYSSIRFTKPVEVRGSGGLTIAGNAWFDGALTTNRGGPFSFIFSGASGKLLIVGDAYFRHPIDFNSGTNQNQKNYVCVGRNAYLYNHTTKQYQPYTFLKTADSCPPVVYEELRYLIDTWEVFGDIDGELIITY